MCTAEGSSPSHGLCILSSGSGGVRKGVWGSVWRTRSIRRHQRLGAQVHAGRQGLPDAPGLLAGAGLAWLPVQQCQPVPARPCAALTPLQPPRALTQSCCRGLAGARDAQSSRRGCRQGLAQVGGDSGAALQPWASLRPGQLPACLCEDVVTEVKQRLSWSLILLGLTLILPPLAPAMLVALCGPAFTSQARGCAS